MDEAQEGSQRREPQRSQRKEPQTASPPVDKPISDNVQQRFGEAYYSYVQALLDEQIDIPQRTAEAYRNYVRALQETGETAQQRTTEAYRNYVRALQEGWTQVDVNAFDAGSMWSIGRSMVAAASWVGGTI